MSKRRRFNLHNFYGFCDIILSSGTGAKIHRKSNCEGMTFQGHSPSMSEEELLDMDYFHGSERAALYLLTSSVFPYRSVHLPLFWSVPIFYSITSSEGFFPDSNPRIVLSSCPPPCGHFSIQESASGGLSYKAKKYRYTFRSSGSVPIFYSLNFQAQKTSSVFSQIVSEKGFLQNVRHNLRE